NGVRGGHPHIIDSVQALQPPQGPEGSDVGQAEGKTEGVFVAYAGKFPARVLDRYAAAVPVVIRLGGSRLQIRELGVDAQTEACVQPRPAQGSVVQSDTILMEDAGRHHSGACERALSRRVQIRLSAIQIEVSPAVSGKDGARIHPLQRRVVVEGPLEVDPAGLRVQAR